MSDTTLVTGFPTMMARRVARRLLETDADDRVLVLARGKFRGAAEAFVASLPDLTRGRARVLEGDVCDMDLGLAGDEVRGLLDEVTQVHHVATVSYLGARREAAARVNVDGARAATDLAGECRRLRRLVHWSTVQVAGDRQGVVLEEELDVGQRFRNFFEEQKFRAEQHVQAASRRLPITVVRPGLVVGDSQTGEIDRFDGPYYLVMLMVASPVDMRLPLPGGGHAPLHLVPIDFVVDAAVALGRDERAVGRTFHVVDPSPFAAKTVLERVARAAERKPPRGALPSGLARAIARVPGMRQLARGPLAFAESLDRMVFYNARHTLELLDGTGIRCPTFDAYVDALVSKVRSARAEKRRHSDEELDPLD